MVSIRFLVILKAAKGKQGIEKEHIFWLIKTPYKASIITMPSCNSRLANIKHDQTDFDSLTINVSSYTNSWTCTYCGCTCFAAGLRSQEPTRPELLVSASASSNNNYHVQPRVHVLDVTTLLQHAPSQQLWK